MPKEPSPHRIRLRGPWDVRPHAGDAPAGRMTVPGTLRDGGWTGFAGRVSFYRRFGRPSNLAPTEMVRLVFERIVGPAEVRLNDDALGLLAERGSFEITKRLAKRNTLEVIVDAADDGCGIVGDVTLEISELTGLAAVPYPS
jgi:hypothetical protein